MVPSLVTSPVAGKEGEKTKQPIILKTGKGVGGAPPALTDCSAPTATPAHPWSLESTTPHLTPSLRRDPLVSTCCKPSSPSNTRVLVCQISVSP